MKVWQRYTERARRVVYYAQEESTRLGNHDVSAGHLLLGLLRDVQEHNVWPPPPTDRVDPAEIAAWVLRDLRVDPKAMREELERRLTPDAAPGTGDKKLMPDGKQVVSFAYDEARTLNCSYIGTEHLLLGLIRDKSRPAGQVLAQSGVDYEHARQQVAALLFGPPPASEPTEDAPAPEKKNFWSRLFRP